MAVIRDVMPAFELFQPATVNDALTLLDRHGSNAWILAGGLDTFDWLKDRSKRTNVVIDLSQMSELRGIKEVEGGVEIGALTTLTEVARHPVIRARWTPGPAPVPKRHGRRYRPAPRHARRCVRRDKSACSRLRN